MNKLKIVAIVFLITLVSGSCKKDYPRDIPDWLKDRIKDVKKNGDSFTTGTLNIDEYSNGTNSVFWFYTPDSYVYRVYDFHGVRQCTFNIFPQETCGNINNLLDFNFKRHVWTQKNK